MNNYIWNRKNVELLPNEIAPWKLPRDKHATISVLTHYMSELHTVDDYISSCEQKFVVEYIKTIYCSTEQTWNNAMSKLNAQFNKRRRNVVLECLQFGGNKEFCNGFPNEYEIEGYFKKCYSFAVDKIGYLGTDKNIICAVIITEANRRNLFVYYLPVTPKWKVKIMSKEKNDYGTLLQLTDENGEPLYREKEDFDSPLLCRTEFWKQRGGITSFSNLQEDFYKEELLYVIKDKFSLTTKTKNESMKCFAGFSEKEILKMPKQFRKEFRTAGCTAHVLKRRSGKNNWNYMIRYRKNGYNVVASSNNLEEAKRKFIEKLLIADKFQKQQTFNSFAVPAQPIQPTITVVNGIPSTLDGFANYYFETFYKRKVCNESYRIAQSNYRNHVLPHFGNVPLTSITANKFQELIDKFLSLRSVSRQLLSATSIAHNTRCKRRPSKLFSHSL